MLQRVKSESVGVTSRDSRMGLAGWEIAGQGSWGWVSNVLGKTRRITEPRRTNRETREPGRRDRKPTDRTLGI